jgi:hypothetical protein
MGLYLTEQCSRPNRKVAKTQREKSLSNPASLLAGRMNFYPVPVSLRLGDFAVNPLPFQSRFFQCNQRRTA